MGVRGGEGELFGHLWGPWGFPWCADFGVSWRRMRRDGWQRQSRIVDEVSFMKLKSALHERIWALSRELGKDPLKFVNHTDNPNCATLSPPPAHHQAAQVEAKSVTLMM